MGRRFVFLMMCAGLFLFSPAKSCAQEGQAGGQNAPLSVEDCVGIALENQPSVIAGREAVFASQSRVGQAGANYYPQVDLTAGYSRTHATPSSSRPSITANQDFELYSGSIGLRQNIFDFGKTTAGVRVQELNTDAFGGDLRNTLVQTVFNVKQAYYGLLLSKKNAEVARETVAQFEQHLLQARGFFETGAKPRFDVTKAEVDLSNAKVNLIRAENAVDIAMAGLKNAMGVPRAPDFEIVDSLAFDKYEITLEEAVSRAFRSRPDLKSAVARRRAAEESVALSKKDYYPELAGNGAYNWSGREFPLEEGWNAGVTLSLPLFSGFLTKYQVQESKANLKIAEANESGVRQNLVFEVEQAYLNIKEAEKRVPAAELAVRQAVENLELANGRYSAGVGSPLEVTDATVALINARTAYIQALSDYRVAQASLERAMGETVD